MASDGIDLIFDPIFGVQSKKKLVDDSEKLGEASGKKFNEGFKDGTGSFGGAFKKIKSGATSAGGTIKSSFKSVFGSLSGEVAAVGGLIATAFATKGLVQAAAQVEQMSVKMRTLTGSTAKAKDVMDDLRQFAAKTPFQLTGIVSAASKLVSFGKSTEETKIAIREIGEAAAGSGSDIGNLATIYGQVGAAGKLTGERLLQFQERAIPIGPAIAKTMGVAESSVRKLVSEGKVTAEIFEQSFRSMTTSGGIFAGAMEAQSKTLTGVFSTFKDSIFDLQATMGEKFGPIIVATMNEAIKIIGKFTDNLKKNAVQSMKDFTQTAIEAATIFNDLFLPVIVGVARTFNILKKTIVLALQSVVVGLAELLKIGAKVTQHFGGKGPITDGLIAFSETSKKVFNDMTADFAETSNKLFDPMPIKDKLARIIENIRNGAMTVEEIIKGTTDKTTISMGEAVEGLGSRFSGAIDIMTAKYGDFAKGFKVTSASIAKTAVTGLGGGVASGFAAVGAALVKGENALEAFGKAFLAAIGQTLVSLGTRFILEGIAVSLSPFTPGAGGPLIAAGAAMTLAGGAMGAIGGGAAGGGSGGGGVGAQSSVTNQDTLENAVIAEPEERETKTGVNVNIAGDFLDSDEGGLKIVEAVNRAFETQGAIIRTNVA